MMNSTTTMIPSNFQLLLSWEDLLVVPAVLRTLTPNVVPSIPALFTFAVKDTVYGFYLLDIFYWTEVLSALLFGAMIGVFLSYIVYQFIILEASRTTTIDDNTVKMKQQLETKNNERKAATTRRRRSVTPLSLLLGWGILIPFLIFGPRVLMGDWIENKIVRFAAGCVTPTIYQFRILEAVYGFEPSHVSTSFSSYCLYFASPMLLKYKNKNDNYKPLKYDNYWQGVRSTFGHFLLLSFVTGMFHSCFVIFNETTETTTTTEIFPSFDMGAPTHSEHFYSWSSAWNVHYWKDSLLYGLLLALYLSTFASGLAFATTTVTGGIQVHPMMDNPMFASMTPSEFWGRRWNLLIHKCLKHGIYKPVRSMGGSPFLAMLAAFLVSGAFHECLLHTVFTDYPIRIGGAMCFFTWQAACVALEQTSLGRNLLFAKESKVPTPFRTLFLLLLGVPMAHWFLDPYVRTDFFLHGLPLFCSILPVVSKSAF